MKLDFNSIMSNTDEKRAAGLCCSFLNLHDHDEFKS